MSGVDLSEHAVRPRLMLVHDPTRWGAFAAMEGLSGDALRRATLFRERPDVERLRDEHAGLVRAVGARVPIVYLEEFLGAAGRARHRETLAANPNFLFTHDPLITIPWVAGGYLLGAMREPLRRGEGGVLAEVAEALGLRPIGAVPDGVFLEGGDLIPLDVSGRRVVLVGYGPRTTRSALTYLQTSLVTDGLADEIVGVELAPERLNLDGCFFPVSRDTLVVNRDSIVGGVRGGPDGNRPVDPLRLVADWGFTLVEASREESFRMQACNFACLGAGEVVAYSLTERINDALRVRGLRVTSTAGRELVKGNGGPHCMTRPIY